MESSLAWPMGGCVQMFREQKHLCRQVSLESCSSARLHCNFTLWPIQVARNHFLPRPPCHLTKLCRYSLISSSLMPSSVFWKFDPSPWQEQCWQHPRVSHSGVLLQGFLSGYFVLALWCHSLHFPLSVILSKLQIHIILMQMLALMLAQVAVWGKFMLYFPGGSSTNSTESANGA